jgi:hypothetical protein
LTSQGLGRKELSHYFKSFSDIYAKELQKNKKKSVTIAGEPYFQPENSPVCSFIETLSYIFKYLRADELADETDVEKLKGSFFFIIPKAPAQV